MTQEQNTFDQFGLHLECRLVAKAMCDDIGPVEEFSVYCGGANRCLAQRISNGNIFDLMLSMRTGALNKMNAEFSKNNAPHAYRPDAPTEVRTTVCGAVCGEYCPSVTEDQRKILFVYNGPEE
jgi:hypothetical protein